MSKKPSLLQAQLAEHRAAHPLPAPLDAKKRRPTILFADDAERANKLDARDVFDLGLSGFTELCVSNPSLKRFHAILFTPSAGTDARMERHLLALSERQAVDEACSELLFDLAPHLQSDAGLKVLEYLIQRFHVHVAAGADLVGAALLFHETPLFAKLLRVHGLAIGPQWPAHLKSTARKHLVEAACKSRAFFEFLCKYTTFDPSDGARMALFAALAVEAVERARGQELAENVVPTVLAHVVACLRAADEPALQAACAVATALCQQTHLANDAAMALCTLLLRRAAKLENASTLLEAALIVFEVQCERDAELQVPPKLVALLQPALLAALCDAEGVHVGQLLTRLAAALLATGNPELIRVYAERVNLDDDDDRARALATALVARAQHARVPGVALLARRLAAARPDIVAQAARGAPADFLEWCFPADAPDAALARLHVVPLAADLPSLAGCLASADAATRTLALRKAAKLVDAAGVAALLFGDAHALGLALAADERFPDVCEAAMALAADVKAATARHAALAHLHRADVSSTLAGSCLALLLALHNGNVKGRGGRDQSEDAEGAVAACANALRFAREKKFETRALDAAAALLPRLLGTKAAPPRAPEDAGVLDALADANPAMALALMDRNLDAFAAAALRVAVEHGVSPPRPDALVQSLGADAVLASVLRDASSALQGPLGALLAAALKAGARVGPLASSADERCAVRALRLLRAWVRAGNATAALQTLLLAPLTSPSKAVRAAALAVAELAPESDVVLSLAWRGRVEIERDSSALRRLARSLPDAFADKLKPGSPAEFAALLALNPARVALAARAVDSVLGRSGGVTEDEAGLLAAALPIVLAAAESDAVAVKALARARDPTLAVLEALGAAPALATPRLLALVAGHPGVVGALGFAPEALAEALGGLVGAKDWDGASALLSGAIAARARAEAAEAQAGFGVLAAPAMRCAREARANGRGVVEQVALCAVERCAGAVAKAKERSALRADLVRSALDASAPQPSRWASVDALRAAGASEVECALLFDAFGTAAMGGDDAWGTLSRLQTLPVAPERLCAAAMRARPADAARIAHALAGLPKVVAVSALLQHASSSAAGGGGGNDVEAMRQAAWALVRPLSLGDTNGVLAALVRMEPPQAAFVAEHLSSREFLRKAALTASAGDTESVVDLVHALLQALAASVSTAAEATAALERALDIMTTLIQLPLFCGVVLEVLGNDDVGVQSLGLRMLRKVDEEHDGWTRAETALVLDLVPQLVAKLGEPNARETCVLALNALARRLAAKHPHVFAPVVPALVDAVRADAALRGAACLCWGELCEPLGTRLLPMLEHVVPEMLAAAAAAATAAATAGDEDETTRAVAVQALVSLLAAVGSGAGPWLEAIVRGAGGDDGVLAAVAQHVEAHQALQAAKRCVASKDDVEHVRGVRLMGLVVERPGLAALLPDAALALLEHARVEGDEEATAATVRMALQLSEAELESMLGAMAAVEAQRAAFLLRVYRLQARFGTLFAPLFPLDLVLATVKASAAAQAAQAAQAAAQAKTAKKRAKLVPAALDSTAERALLALAEFFVHTSTLARERALACLQSLLACARALEGVDRAAVANVLAPAFAGLASAAASAEWQTLVHAVVKEAKAKSASTRWAATVALARMFEKVGAEFLVVMPDVLGVLAELLEDADAGVVEQAQAFVRVLHELSGEDIVKLLN